MKYKYLQYSCSWEIDDVEASGKVCEGFLPNNPEDGMAFSEALRTALLSDNDEGVKAGMKTWIEGMTRPMPPPLLPNIFTSRLGNRET